MPSPSRWCRSFLTLCGAVAAGLSCTGCLTALFKSADDAARSTDYRVERPRDGWTATDPGGGDQTWRNDKDGAVIGVNSVCGQERDRSLKELTRSSLVGLGLGEAKADGKPLTVDAMPALRSDLEGALDGKAFSLTITVIRGRACVYDVSLARGPGAGDHAADYQKVLDSFRAREAH